MPRLPWPKKPSSNRYTIAAELGEITWDRAHPRDSLTKVYVVIDKLIVSETEWYGKHLWQQRLGARFIQLVTVVLLIIGVLLPIVSAAYIARNSTPDWSQAYTAGQIGYAALVMAALLLLLDQVFQLSSGWVRFLSTELRLFTQLLQTRFLWLSLQAAWGDNLLNAEEAQRALNLLRDQVTEVNKIVQGETETWSTELQKGFDALRSRIDTATATAEAQVKAVQAGMVSASDPAIGTIWVEVKGAHTGEEFQVALRGNPSFSERQRTLVPPDNVVFEGLTSGKYVVSVESEEKQKGRRQRVVKLEKGQDAQVSIDFGA